MRARSIMIAIVIALCLVPAYGAYGHGQGHETIQSVSAGERKVDVTVEIHPHAIESQTRRITVTATDDLTQIPTKNVTFMILMIHQGQTVFHEQFFAPDGIVRLDTAPADSVEISGARDAQGVWKAGNEPLTVTGPTLGTGGLYSFVIEITTIDDPTIILENREAYRADVSVVKTTSHLQQDLEGADVQFQIKSYFDTASGLEYDAPEGTLTFEMPFDWNERTISHIPVVHVETHFPKEFAEFMYPSYTAQVNGIDLFKALVTVDDFTDVDDRIVHFVLLGDHIRFLKAQQRQLGQEIPDTMFFMLKASDELQFPMIAYTRGEEFQVDLSWNPVEIQTGEATTFVFTIRDGATGEPLRQSPYDFVILQSGSEVYRATGNAVVGGDFQTYTFAEDQTGPTIVRFENLGRTGAVTEFGIVVVPELGASMAVLLAGAAAAVLLGLRARGSPLAVR